MNELSRDPFYPWDMPTLRRNYGEPLQVVIKEDVFFLETTYIIASMINLLHYFHRRQSPALTSLVYRKTG